MVSNNNLLVLHFLMHNLKSVCGTFKGVIGECLFKAAFPNVILTKFTNKHRFTQNYPFYVSEDKMNFLFDNWHFIDAFGLDSINRTLIIYEIKVKDDYENANDFWKIRMTASTVDIFNKAVAIGVNVKVVTVHLYDDWNFDFDLKDFTESDYCINKPKFWDKKLSDY